MQGKKNNNNPAMAKARSQARQLYKMLHEDEGTAAAIRAAETEEAFEETLEAAGYGNGTPREVITELVRLFARELTDEDLAKVTGG